MVIVDFGLKRRIQETFEAGVKDPRSAESNEELLETANWVMNRINNLKEELETLEDRRLGAGKGKYTNESR